MIYFISDTHFGHKNILKYDQRPFDSIEEHDETLLGNIHKTLQRGDVLLHLGDVAWSQQSFDWFYDNVRKDIVFYFIRGNHDNRWTCPGITQKDVFQLKHREHKFFLSHYPHLSWPNRFHGSLHLFGHVHGNLQGVGRSMDISANMIGYKPISVEEVIEKLSLVEAGE